MTLRAPSGAFSTFLAIERAEIERVLSDVAGRLAAEAPVPLSDALRYALEAPGKRLRPALVVASHQAVTGRPADRALRLLACSLELIHTYSLMHDDLPCMDDDDLRRGRPTTHRVFGETVATLAGATLIPAAFRILLEGSRAMGLASEGRRALALELARGAGANGMVGGQVLDLEAEARAIDTIELEGIHARKTGALFAASLRMGGIAGGAPEHVVHGLGEAGSALGLAFQVYDDVLDETGESSVLGKTAGRDRALSKSTYPALLGLEGARRHAEEAAQRAVRSLRDAGVDDVVLTGLVRFAVERDR